MAEDGELKRAGYGKYVPARGPDGPQGDGLTSLSSLSSTNGSGQTSKTTQTPPLHEPSENNTEQRHSQDVPSSAQRAATEEKDDGETPPDLDPSLSASGAVAPQSAEQGDSENDACWDGFLVKSEEEVFELARVYFGLEPMRERAGAA